MANWVCKQDGVLFPPGMPGCPQCQTRDAFELGGDKSLNLYDAVEVTGIASPGAAWAAVNEGVAAARHELRQEGRDIVSAEEGLARVMANEGGAEVAQRLGLVPGDPGAADSSTDPEPVNNKDWQAGVAPDAPDKALPEEDTPDTGNDKTTSKTGQNDVPS